MNMKMHFLLFDFMRTIQSNNISLVFFVVAIDLKRFSETRWSKMTNIVEFPTGERDLNMAPYAANSASAQYTLYGICNHMGMQFQLIFQPEIFRIEEKLQSVFCFISKDQPLEVIM